METVKTTVDRIIKRWQESKKDNLQVQLKKYLSHAELRHIKICSLRKGIMVLNVDSSVWLYALHLRKQELVRQLGLRDIRLRIGEIK